MKTPLGTEVEVGSGHIVLDGVPALHETGTAAPPPFRPMSVVATVAHLSYCWALVFSVGWSKHNICSLTTLCRMLWFVFDHACMDCCQQPQICNKSVAMLKRYCMWWKVLIINSCSVCDPEMSRLQTTTTTVLRPLVRDYRGEPVPEETLTHPPSWSSSNLYQLLPSTTIHSILLVQITCLAIFLHNLFPWVDFKVHDYSVQTLRPGVRTSQL